MGPAEECRCLAPDVNIAVEFAPRKPTNQMHQLFFRTEQDSHILRNNKFVSQIVMNLYGPPYVCRGGSAMDGPIIGNDLATAINRLGSIRRQLKELETEESVLRNEIMTALVEWPLKWFPVRVGAYEVRKQIRSGKVDQEQAAKILLDKGLLAQVASVPVIQDNDRIYLLRADLSSVEMPRQSRGTLIADYDAAVGERPVIGGEDIQSFYQAGQLTTEEWRECFKDGKPLIEVLMVR